MGGTLCGGSVSSFHGEFILEFNRFATLLTRMGLTQLEARKLYEAYRALDTDNSGVISAEEFRVRTCAPDTPFAAKVYAIFDYRKIGEVDFGEFVAVVWNFCTYTPYTLVSLIFDMYDDDGSGSLDFAEVQKLVRELYGIQSGIDEPRLLAALESLSGGGIFDRSRPIHRDQFETFAIEHPAVVRPALDMQADMRVAVVGARFWEGLSVRRHSLDDMRQPAEFMDQLKHDRSKTVGGLSVGPVPLSEQVAARRAEQFERMAESRQAFIAVFGQAALAGGVSATRSYRLLASEGVEVVIIGGVRPTRSGFRGQHSD